MKLETIYENYFISEAAHIRAASTPELVALFKEAISREPDTAVVLDILKNNKQAITDIDLTNEERVFIESAIRVLAYDENLLTEAAVRDPATGRYMRTPVPPPVPSTSTGSAPASKPSWLGSIAKSIAKKAGSLVRSFASGFKGSEGKDKTGKDVPGWISTKTTADLSSVPERDVSFSPQQLQTFNITPDILKGLEKGDILGVNLSDANNNLVSVKVANGQYIGRRVPTFNQQTPAPAAPRPVTAAVPQRPAPKKPLARPRVTTARETFQKTVDKVIKEFYETSK